MKPTELACWVALSTQAGVGGKTMACLLDALGSVQAVLNASQQKLESVPLVGPKTASAIRRINLEAAEQAINNWQEQGITILTWDDPQYPANLLLADDRPPVLFLRGSLPANQPHALAIVGTRSPTPTGESLALRFALEMAQRGWVVVSGLAVGVDTVAHEGTLMTNGVTLAVLGSGLNQVYPPQNRALADRVMTSGALICEVSPDMVVNAQALVARNRIISGMSKAVVVIESGVKGGSIATARFAARQGRVLYGIESGTPTDNVLSDLGAILLRRDALDWDDISAQLTKGGQSQAR